MPQGVEDWLRILTPKGGRDAFTHDLTARILWCIRSNPALNTSAFRFALGSLEMVEDQLWVGFANRPRISDAAMIRTLLQMMKARIVPW